MTVLADRFPVSSGATTEPEPPPVLPDVDDAQQYYLAGSYQWNLSIQPLAVGPVYIESAPEGLAQVLRKVAAELARLSRLRTGWDGRCAKPITQEAIYATAYILARLLDRHSEVPQFFPLKDGGIQLEWYAENQVEIEIEIDRAGEANVTAQTATGDVLAEGIFDSQGTSELAETIARFVRDLSAHIAAGRRQRS